MTLDAALGLTFARALLVAVAAVVMAAPVARCLRGAGQCGSGRLRAILVAGLLLTLLTPGLLTGYGYANFTLSLARHPSLNEAWYALLLAMKLMPWAAGVLYFAPQPPLPQSAEHLVKLAPPESIIGRRRRWWRWSAMLRGSGRNVALAWAVAFVLAFSEFELASLLGTASWTVWLFDAQVGGLATVRTIAAAAWPLLVQGVVLIAAVALLLMTRGGTGSASHDRPPRRATIPAVVIVLASAAAVLLVPGALVLRQAAGGFAALVRQFTLVTELRSSVLMALVAATIAVGIANLITTSTGRKSRWPLLLALCLPGLMGPLAVGLTVQWLAQQPPLRWAYDTPLPLMTALVVLLLPLAVALHLGVSRIEPTTAVHVAALLRQSPTTRQRRAAADLLWRLRSRPRWVVAFVLFLFAYFDLLASALLAPTGMTPAPARLYNLMHYGHSAVLSALLCVTIGLPLAMLAAATGVRFAYRRLA